MNPSEITCDSFTPSLGHDIVVDQGWGPKTRRGREEELVYSVLHTIVSSTVDNPQFSHSSVCWHEPVRHGNG